MTSSNLVDSRRHFHGVPHYNDLTDDFYRRQWVDQMAHARMWTALGNTAFATYCLESAAYYRRLLTPIQ